MTTLLLVSGSQRRESFNARLLRHLSGFLVGQCELDMLEPSQVDLPIFDQDLESDSAVSNRVAMLHRRFQACDGIVVASPEYNGQLTPYLKNIVDWISRLSHIDSRFNNPFSDRAVLLCSASTGWSGGSVAMPHARALFTYVGCRVVSEAISVAHADQAWTGDTYMFDPFFDAEIDAATGLVLQLAKSFSQSRNALTEAA